MGSAALVARQCICRRHSGVHGSAGQDDDQLWLGLASASIFFFPVNVDFLIYLRRMKCPLVEGTGPACVLFSE